MNFTVEKIAEGTLSLSGKARALLADRLAESPDPLEDGYIRQLWVTEVRTRRDEVRSGTIKTISGHEALARMRKSAPIPRWGLNF